MCDVLNQFDSSIIPNTVRQIFEMMYSMHCPLKIKPAELLSSQIRNLQSKRMMGFYVRDANCGMMLLGTEEPPEIIIATFQPNLTNAQIYGTDQNLIRDSQVDRASSIILTTLLI